jgi:hypothetical protein
LAASKKIERARLTRTIKSIWPMYTTSSNPGVP